MRVTRYARSPCRPSRAPSTWRVTGGPIPFDWRGPAQQGPREEGFSKSHAAKQGRKLLRKPPVKGPRLSNEWRSPRQGKLHEIGRHRARVCVNLVAADCQRSDASVRSTTCVSANTIWRRQLRAAPMCFRPEQAPRRFGVGCPGSRYAMRTRGRRTRRVPMPRNRGRTSQLPSELGSQGPRLLRSGRALPRRNGRRRRPAAPAPREALRRGPASKAASPPALDPSQLRVHRPRTGACKKRPAPTGTSTCFPARDRAEGVWPSARPGPLHPCTGPVRPDSPPRPRQRCRDRSRADRALSHAREATAARIPSHSCSMPNHRRRRARKGRPRGVTPPQVSAYSLPPRFLSSA